MAQWRQPSGGDARVETTLSGGINTGASSFDIADNQSVNEYGWDTDEHYPALSTAKSHTIHGPSGGSVTRLLTNFGNIHLVRSVGTTLQYDSSGTWTDIGEFTNTDWDAANFDVNGPALILTNGSDNPRYWNGSTLSVLPQAPKGKYVAADNRRVYIANGDEVNYCAFQDAKDWTSELNAGIVQHYTPNGGDVTALKSFQGQIWAFKKDAFALIFHTGDSRAAHRLVDGSYTIGCVANKTVIEVGNLLFWLGQNDIYMGAAGSAKEVGEPVRKYLKSINWNQIDKCCAFTDGIRYYLNLVTGTNDEPDTRLMYDPRHKIWRVCALNEKYRYGAMLNNILYAGDANGQTFRLNARDTDVNATSMIETKDFDRSEAEKEYNALHLQMDAPEGTTLKIEASVDQGKTYYTIGDPIQPSSVAQNQNIIIPLDTVPIGNWVRFRFSAKGKFRLYGFERYFKTHPVQI